MFTTLNQLIDSHKKAVVFFLLIGATAALINMGLFSFFWQLMGLNYLVAVSIAYVLTILYHFTMNRRYTFESHGANLTNHIKKYIVLAVLNYILALIVVNFSVKILQLSPYLGVVFSLAFNMCVSYVMSRCWVFR